MVQLLQILTLSGKPLRTALRAVLGAVRFAFCNTAGLCKLAKFKEDHMSRVSFTIETIEHVRLPPPPDK